MTRFAGLAAVLALHAAGAAWAWRLVAVGVSPALAGWVLAATLAAAGLAFAVADRRHVLVLPRLGAYGAGCCVAAGHIAVDVVVPFMEVAGDGLPAVSAWLGGLAGWDLFRVAAPIPAVAVTAMFWLELIGVALGRAGGGRRRRRADSDLYGKARLLSRRWLRRLERGHGILLGQAGPGRHAPPIAWPLEGSVLSFAPPRTGKTATIALNLLAPGDRGWPGSTVTIDPRGELFPVVARRRRELGRNVILLDPFGAVAQHRATVPGLHLPEEVEPARYNPLDWIRDAPDHAPRDINTLLDAFTTPPPSDGPGNSRHFFELARTLIGGYAAYVRFCEPAPADRTLGRMHELITARATSTATIKTRMDEVGNYPAAALTRQAMALIETVGTDESGSAFSTVNNQLKSLIYPQLLHHTAASTFDPMVLASGDVDLFVVVPEEQLDAAQPWLRLWITIPSAVASRRPLDRDMLIVIDEMPRIGRLKPVIDAYAMASGRGVHFWGIAQSISALEATWGRDNRRMLIDLAEVIQILGWPRTDAAGAEEISKAIGHATYESRSESISGSTPAGPVLAGTGQVQAGENRSLVRERLIQPDELMTLGPDRQFVVASPKDMPRDALHLHHARYWTRPDCRELADPNPLVVRKTRAAEAAGADRAI